MPSAGVEITAARCLTEGMRHVAGGSFLMGSDKHYPEEWPAHHARVSAFWMDETTVTNDQFSRFVAETGYVTVAERPGAQWRHPEEPGSDLSGRGNHPVVQVAYEDVDA